MWRIETRARTKNNEDEGEQGEQTSERTADKKSESNVKEDGEETNNVEVHIKGKVATVQELLLEKEKTSKLMESVTPVGLQ